MKTAENNRAVLAGESGESDVYGPNEKALFW